MYCKIGFACMHDMHCNSVNRTVSCETKCIPLKALLQCSRVKSEIKLSPGMQLVEAEEPPCRWSGRLMPRGAIPFLIEIYTDLCPRVISSSAFQGLVSTEMLEIPPKIN